MASANGKTQTKISAEDIIILRTQFQEHVVAEKEWQAQVSAKLDKIVDSQVPLNRLVERNTLLLTGVDNQGGVVKDVAELKTWYLKVAGGMTTVMALISVAIKILWH